jgi:hypothetical protein
MVQTTDSYLAALRDRLLVDMTVSMKVGHMADEWVSSTDDQTDTMKVQMSAGYLVV